MGAVNSCWLPHYQNPNQCRESHTSTPKIKGHRRNISAAFNMADMAKESNLEKLNINSATEEELMTLPGINRLTAHNIVDYRRQIGGFKKVEDLALVSGVGATKLSQIRMEICTSRKKTSQSSSRSSSVKDLSIQDDISKSSSKSALRVGATYPRANLNTSNVFQLMKVKGISQQMAENIVAYRDKKGPFKNIDDLVKVKGMGPGIVSAVRPYLVLSGDFLDTIGTHNMFFMNGAPASSSHASLYNVRSSGETANYTNYHLNTTCPPALGSSQEDLISLYGPLVRRSLRKRVAHMSFQRDDRQVVRVATWNLQNCTLEKAENPGVKEVVCMTLLEKGLSIIALQELEGSQPLLQLCEELNQPTVPNVKKWTGPRGSWQYVASPASTTDHQGADSLGFLYDVNQGIEVIATGLLSSQRTAQQNGSPSIYKVFMAHFKMKDLDFVVFNVKVTGQLDAEAEDIIQAIEQHSQDCRNVLILGDFSSLLTAENCKLFEERGYQGVIATSAFTDITTRDMVGSRHEENIWMGGQFPALHTGQSDVIRDGLTSPWIADGWKWGGLVSTHCPVWAEFYTHPLQDSRRKGDPSKLYLPLSGAGDS